MSNANTAPAAAVSTALDMHFSIGCLLLDIEGEIRGCIARGEEYDAAGDEVMAQKMCDRLWDLRVQRQGLKKVAAAALAIAA